MQSNGGVQYSASIGGAAAEDKMPQSISDLRTTLMGPTSNATNTTTEISWEQFKAKARQKFAHDLVGWKYWLLIFSILVSAGLAVVQVFLRFLQYHTPDGATAIQGVLEIVAWGVAIWRNLFLISTIRKQHRDVGSGQAFSWPAILYHSTLGRQSAFVLSCLVLIVTGFMMRFIASRVSPDQGGATLALAVIAANCVNYASLIALIAAVDNGFHKIKTIANSIAVFQVIMFGQDIALHVLYQLAVCDHHNIDACNAAKAHGCLGPPADTAAQVKLCAPCKPFSCYDQRVGDARFGERFTTLRLASLATLILLRVKVYTFFKFKAEEPDFSYCLEVRRAVPEGPTGRRMAAAKAPVDSSTSVTPQFS